MAITEIRNDIGHPRHKCTCDVCGRQEVIAARSSSDEVRSIKRLVGMKWSFLKKTLRCPACEAARKSGKQECAKVQKPKPVDDVREPTRSEKREIMDLLKEYYDAENERYLQGDTDDTIAEALGVMPGWVSQIREDFFGPVGANEDMAALKVEVFSFVDLAEKEIKKAQLDIAALEDAVVRAKGYASRLAGIEKAVGRRVMARVK